MMAALKFVRWSSKNFQVATFLQPVNSGLGWQLILYEVRKDATPKIRRTKKKEKARQ
jgi:hypothetical protein